MRKLFLVIAVLSLLFVSCEFGNITTSETEKKFWALNTTTGLYYQLDAERLASNSLCEIWVEKNSGVTESTAKAIANEYSNVIYPKMTGVFNWTGQYGNAMRYADLYGDNNGKLTILLLDIKDGYVQGGSYVAGYFSSINLYTNASLVSAGYGNYKSNECDMIYMDINPGTPASDAFYGTLAHEMQHMMNFVLSNIYRSNNNTLYPMDTWIDEGLSSAAEWIYSGGDTSNRIGWYNNDPSGLIKQGNNFFMWDNRDGNGAGKSPNALLDDYATVYLFFQWLRLQSSTEIYNKIITSPYPYYDHNAVTNAVINAFSDPSPSYSWDELLRDWLAANNIQSSSGRYGYKSDSTFFKLEKHYVPSGTTSVNLFQGEGVYSIINSTISPSSSGNILYAGLNNGNVSSGTSFSSGVLLTYNGNNDNQTDASEIGITTGIASSVTVEPTVAGRSVQSQITGPFPIGAGDLLRRRGHERILNEMGLAKPLLVLSDE